MVDYSVWDHIEVSDDEDETHPNIDTASLFRWRHQARVERMEQFQKEKEELDKGCRECKRRLAECQKRMKELELAEPQSGKGELEKLQAEAQQLRNEEKSWESKLEELRKKEKNMPWNVDTLSKDGFSKSVFNVKPEEKEETEEQKEKKHKTFVERYEKQIKHFGEGLGASGSSFLGFSEPGSPPCAGSSPESSHFAGKSRIFCGFPIFFPCCSRV
ncbi:hsp90 co-chaperone Cdc37-like [Pyrgilauda ruficollis]|uniref:hsp90 co-chaperone Cdc37-like n=1 Tax=Pyrgilauda ruficollis TaxID=221976 RepID=UPI001B86E02D|nr:hsp90 co-chaperone Cdc37-like [Pyrgilauda ruficollis]